MEQPAPQPIELIRSQRQLLADLFTMEWLEASGRKHPASQRFALCTELLQQGGIVRFPEQEKHLPDFLSMMLDALAFVIVSRGDLDSFTLGNVAGYGGDDVQRKIRTRIRDRRQFGSLMLELSIGAWHRSHGHDVTPLEQEGMPDLRIRMDQVQLPLYVECKRISTLSANGIRRSIRDANRQLRHVTEESFGVLVLDISAAVGLVLPGSDAPPPTVLQVAETTRRSLTGSKNRSVCRAILVWDDALFLGPAPHTFQTVVLRRNRMAIDHSEQEGVRKVPQGTRLFGGNTVMMAFRHADNLHRVRWLTLTPVAKTFMNAFHIAGPEVQEAYENRDKVDSLHLENDPEVVLFARRTVWRGLPSYLLCCGAQRGERLEVLFALRVPSRLYEKVDLCSVFEMLTLFVDTYGFRVAFGGLLDKLIYGQRTRLPKRAVESGAPFVTIEGGAAGILVSLFRSNTENDDIEFYCGLVFAVNTGVVQGHLGIVSPVR